MIHRLGAVSVGWLGISMVADALPAVLVPRQLVAAGGGATELGLLTLAAIALAALVQPFAGAWSDRVGPAPTIGAGITLSVMGLAVLLSPAALLPGTVLALTGVSVAQAGYQTLLPARITPAWRGRAAGVKGLFDVGGAFLGFAIVGAVLAVGGAEYAAAVLGAGLTLSLGLALLLQRGRPFPPSPAAPPSESWRHLLRPHAGLLPLMASRFLFLLGIYGVGRFLLLYLGDRLGLGADAAAGGAGTLLAALTLMTALAALPAGWLADRFGRGPLMLGGGALAAAGVAALPLAASLPLVLCFGTLMAVGVAAFGAGSWAMLADISAGRHSGRLLGIANLGTAGAAAGAGLFGPLIDAGEGVLPGAGYDLAFVMAGMAALAGAVVGWGVSTRAPYRPPAAVPEAIG